MKQRGNIDLLIIDYLQLLRSESAQAKDNRQNEVAEISRGIKALAKELKIPIIILAQLNRKSEEAKAEPALHNLRESGAIEQDADMVLLLHRVEQEKDADGNDRPHDSIMPYILNIAKQRNGPTDRVDILSRRSTPASTTPCATRRGRRILSHVGWHFVIVRAVAAQQSNRSRRTLRR